MIDKCFDIVASVLYSIARATGMTYNEINIIVYYLIVPLTWTVMIDILLKKPIITPLLLIAWAIIFFAHRKDFRKWCDWAFQKSVDFLLWFKRIGWDYILSSVIICVVIPIVIYATLITALIKL
ncbi:MAG: hypothetical protein IKX31_05155 [Muribaculaceae bacterium]|nr:hypothetical protein [Muribaculaceae bacterium]